MCVCVCVCVCVREFASKSHRDGLVRERKRCCYECRIEMKVVSRERGSFERVVVLRGRCCFEREGESLFETGEVV